MKAEVHFVRRRGIKVPEREAGGIAPLVGNLKLTNRYVSASVALPVLELRAVSNVTDDGLLALLYEPRLLGMHHNWMRFTGFEVYKEGDEKQLVVQDWRCYIRG